MGVPGQKEDGGHSCDGESEMSIGWSPLSGLTPSQVTLAGSTVGQAG